MKKYIAEMFGTMVLVLMGCGTAISLSCTSADPNLSSTVIGTAQFENLGELVKNTIFVA